MFYVGQRVVCVDDSPHFEGTAALKMGAVYTVRNFHECPDGRVGMRLSEVTLPLAGNGIEHCFRQSRFRPVTDISDLQAIVAEVKTGKPRKIKADRFDKVRT